MHLQLGKKIKLGFLLIFLTFPLYAKPAIEVLVSFSMPEQLFKEILADAQVLKIPVLLNGLYNNSMPQTLAKIFELTNEFPQLNLAIDPTAFERFGIKQVPALVVEGNKTFDVLYGNLALRKGLEKIIEEGDCGLSMEEVEGLKGE